MEIAIGVSCAIIAALLLYIAVCKKKNQSVKESNRKVPYSDMTKEYLDKHWEETFGKKTDGEIKK